MRTLNPLYIGSLAHFTIKMHFILNVYPLYFPRVTVAKPKIRYLHLMTSFDGLLEDTIVISDAVTPSREV